MIFENIKIKNFRNFDDVDVKLSNKNIFFGMNDVGKTNFLYALRFVFDKDIRKNNLIDSDFHNKNVDEKIEIIVTIDISKIEDADCQKLRARLKGALLSPQNKVYIKLEAEYDKKELFAMPILYWGGDVSKLQEMKQKGNFYELDYVFNVVYIDSYIDVYSLFRKNIYQLIKNEKETDKTTLEQIENSVKSLNEEISSLSGIKEFESKVNTEYTKYHSENISIAIKSEIAVKGLNSNLIPYIKQGQNDQLYPTAGDGRKKLLAYSIFDMLSDDTAEKKINIFLVEEPENHLHKSMQIALSQILFTNNKYSYLFVSTHSPFILYEMDNVNLVRIYNESKIVSSSTFYKVPSDFETTRKMLNRSLSEAIFANRVLLVEGPSEELLFGKVLSIIHSFYESDGIYILPVNGIGFEKYIKILGELNIKTIIKTDNDLKKNTGSADFYPLGFSRCNIMLNKKILPIQPVIHNSITEKRKIYNANLEILNKIRGAKNLYLSKVDLENDLNEVLHRKLVEYCGNNPVKYLQDSKRYHMVELIGKLSEEDCRKIYAHYNFACLKKVNE